MVDGFHWKEHPESPSCDRVLVQAKSEVAGINRIELALVERYKMSGMSGDEWRFEWVLKATGSREPVESSCGRVACDGLALIPRVLEGAIEERGWAGFIGGVDGDATVEIHNKGVLCIGRRFSNLIAAAMNAPWWAQVFGQQEDHDSDVYRSLYTGWCAQPGCDQKYEVVYEINQEYERYRGRELPPNSLGPVHRAFCLKHARRGDCALEDADDNYTVVSAPDGFDPQTLKVDPAKVSKSRTIL